MFYPPYEGRPLQLTRTVLTLLAPLLLLGCANPGPPKPPSLHLPKPVTGLSAERTGNRVLLSFTVQGDTTDGGGTKPPFTAVICRDTPTPLADSSTCVSIQRVRVAAGPAHAGDDLPPALASGPASLIAYRVELLNAFGRSAGLSAPVYSVAGSSPAPAGPLSITAQRNAALITWESADPTAPMRLTRVLTATATGPVVPVGSKKPTKSSPLPKSSNARPQQLTLTQPQTASSLNTDSGGMIDRSIRDGDTLTYTAQRVHTVEFPLPAAPSPSIPGQRPRPSTLSLELRGEPSPPKTFVFHDIIPPSIPTGLAAVPGGGFGEAPSIDLSWDPNPESDLFGYNIYRADAQGGAANAAFTRLNPEPTPSPAFRDPIAAPGHLYLYRIAAVDQRRNESSPSPAIQAQLHP